MPQKIDSSQPLLVTPDIPQFNAIVSGITHLHAHCILYDGTLATYVLPLSYAKMLGYWQGRLEHVKAGMRHIIIQIVPVSSRTAQHPIENFFEADDRQPPYPRILLPSPAHAGQEEAYEVAGVVSLFKPESETGPHRAEVEKLFTSPNHRRKGIARSLMRKLEECAVADDRWSLILDTIVGTDADSVYPRLGYIRLGEVKAHGIHPKTRELMDESFYWKDVRNSTPL